MQCCQRVGAYTRGRVRVARPTPGGSTLGAAKFAAKLIFQEKAFEFCAQKCLIIETNNRKLNYEFQQKSRKFSLPPGSR